MLEQPLAINKFFWLMQAGPFGAVSMIIAIGPFGAVSMIIAIGPFGALSPLHIYLRPRRGLFYWHRRCRLPYHRPISLFHIPLPYLLAISLRMIPKIISGSSLFCNKKRFSQRFSHIRKALPAKTLRRPKMYLQKKFRLFSAWTLAFEKDRDRLVE